MWRKFVGVVTVFGGVPVVGWQFYKKSELSLPVQRPQFDRQGGGLDDNIENSLKAGDIVLYNRRCEILNAPSATLCALETMTRRTRPGRYFDHIAVVLRGPHGDAMVTLAEVDMDPYAPLGPRIIVSPYVDRMWRTREPDMMVLPLKKPLSKEEANKLFTYVQNALKGNSNALNNHSFWGAVARCLHKRPAPVPDPLGPGQCPRNLACAFIVEAMVEAGVFERSAVQKDWVPADFWYSRRHPERLPWADKANSGFDDDICVRSRH